LLPYYTGVINLKAQDLSALKNTQIKNVKIYKIASTKAFLILSMSRVNIN
jgi:hypothetical protein